MTKERLTELIKQCETIYELEDDVNIAPLKLDILYCRIAGDCLLFQDYAVSFNRLFETESEAQHYAKYGTITRMEKMPVPPTWEEVKEWGNYIVGNFEIIFYNYKIVLIELRLEEVGELDYLKYKDYEILRLIKTEENYYKALDKMVELWREEV